MNPAQKTLVEVTDLGILRAGRWLLRGVNLRLRRGELVTVVGPNGGGKSTLAKAILGITPASEGQVKCAPGLRVGYVPQRLEIEPSIPLNVARFLTLADRFTNREIAAVLARVGIAHLARAQIRDLSGGELQRAMLARAILRKPDFLVLDEPVQGVDASGEIALYRLIAQIRDELDCAILLISHDLHIVMAQTDTVVCLNHHVCCSGPPRSVAASAEFAQMFGPGADKVLALYQHIHDHEHTLGGDIPGSDIAGGHNVG
ncbi:MAG: ATP-binding cassette domain-containing protein [Alphaproteobacteria bacterium]